MLKALCARTQMQNLDLTCAPPPHRHPAGEQAPCLEPRELGGCQRPQTNQRGQNMQAGIPHEERRIRGSAGPWQCSAWTELVCGRVHWRPLLLHGAGHGLISACQEVWAALS